MTPDLRIIAAAFKQGGGGVPLLRKSINAVKGMKTADPGGALQSFQSRFSQSTQAAEPNGQIRESSGAGRTGSRELIGSREDNGTSH